NYISNAINHIDGEKLLKISLTDKGDTVRISVFNTGKHIPDSDIAHIWEKFYKVDKARTREYGGSGIGLSIVSAIMQSHHRDYGVKNVDGGVEFYFELDKNAVVKENKE
nr:HAMP domain-containing histidine kinase [Lachnospiraceae bacterium]